MNICSSSSLSKHMWGIFGCTVCQQVLFSPADICQHIFEEHAAKEGDPGEEGEGGGAKAVKCPSCKRDVLLEDGVKTLNEHYM